MSVNGEYECLVGEKGVSKHDTPLFAYCDATDCIAKSLVHVLSTICCEVRTSDECSLIRS